MSEYPSTHLCQTCSVLRLRGNTPGFVEINKSSGIRLHLRDRSGFGYLALVDFHHHDIFPDLPHFTESARLGCAFCKFLRTIFVEDWSQNYNRVEAPEQYSLHIHSAIITRAEAQVGKMSRGPSGMEINWKIYGPKCTTGIKRRRSEAFCFRTSPGTVSDILTFQFAEANKLVLVGDPICDYLGTSFLLPETGSFVQNNTQKISRWISDCKMKHPSCTSRQGGDAQHPWPSRLVEIRKDEGSGLPLTRLVDTRSWKVPGDHSSTSEYAALSYCWGASEFLRTTAASISSHLHHVPFCAMPQAFQDVISLCMALGIRFLWIDALCIIQGDPADWSSESSKMSDVYRNALVTIILASGCTPHDGVLQTAAYSSASPCQISYQFGAQPEETGSYFIDHVKWPESKNRINDPAKGAEDEVLCGPWMTRAWTLQEHMLSRRRLYLGLRRTFFSCQVQSRIEDASGAFRPFWPARKASSSSQSAASIKRDQFQEWYTLVEDYTPRGLTNTDDKLPAIAGLAHAMSSDLGHYCAGLWVNDIPRGLLWESPRTAWPADEDPLPLRHCDGYRAPSWSWAAYDSPISYLTQCSSNREGEDDVAGLSKSEVELLEAKTVPIAEDPFGRIMVGGYLRLRARVKAIPARAISTDQRVPSMTGRVAHGLKLQISESFDEHDFVAFLDSSAPQTWEPLHFMPVVSEAVAEEEAPFYSAGLILKSSPGKCDHYERIGIYSEEGRKEVRANWANPTFHSRFTDEEWQEIVLI